MTKYLYGAAVQGIQGFIFQTNKLQDIVGASELVELICMTAFDEYANEDGESVLRAAGNIKHIFDSEEVCKKTVLEFPKKVVEMAPGITVSQAVVKYDDAEDFAQVVDALEAKLREQRNKQMRPLNIGFMGVLRSRRTGFPVVAVKENKRGEIEFVDAATEKKWAACDTQKLSSKAFGFDVKDKQVAFEIEKITGKNDWIAVIHADGNGLGQVVQKIGHDREKFKKFSLELDKATKNAAVDAFEMVKDSFEKSEIIPIRPVVLGGDDFTVICRADFALDYVTAFLKAFEKRSGEGVGQLLEDAHVFENGNFLTACAGISFVKSSYPFYFAYDLAEALCSCAKKDSKKPENPNYLAPSCLMFHKVQSSFVEDFESIVQKELTPCKGCSFEFGPYYLNEKDRRWTIDKLQGATNLLDSEKGNAVKSGIRQWLTLMHSNKDMAKQKAERLISLLGSGSELRTLVKEMTDGVDRDGKICYSAYDVLAIHSVRSQETRSNEKGA